ncbi:MAG: biopolymer transporter ExbD [Deltaproteobacteria bacterium]|nr:biopolymer transporter ExbD [Deltaproteobacteria bacterium]
MAGGAQDNEDEIVGINVTPLVDITLVLLIIFMVTAPIINETGSNKVELPRAANAGEALKGILTVVFEKDGKMAANGAYVDEAGLKQMATAELRKDAKLIAIIDADQALSYGQVMHVVDILKGEGVGSISFTVKKQAAAKAP